VLNIGLAAVTFVPKTHNHLHVITTFYEAKFVIEARAVTFLDSTGASMQMRECRAIGSRATTGPIAIE
jgi:hypothetical protein